MYVPYFDSTITLTSFNFFSVIVWLFAPSIEEIQKKQDPPSPAEKQQNVSCFTLGLSYCCLQGQLCGLCLWFLPKQKMRMVLRIKMTLQK